MNTIKTEDKIEIKQGYKKTSVGIIPEDWEVRKLDEVTIKTFSGTTPNRSNSEYYKDGQIPWIKSGELNNWNVIETEEKITKKALKNTSLRLVKPNTIIYALYGATAGIVSETKIKATINQAILAIYLKESYSKNFIKYQLYYNKDRFINKYTQGGQPNLNSKIVRNYDLIIPPLPEQKAIADCLSTWDKAIEKLSALIASKKEQKKGLMQGLFSGELKVENGELVKIEDEKLWLKGWEEVRLGDIGVFRTSSVNKKIVESETKVWLLNYMDVYKNTHITSEIEFQLTSAKDSQIESSNLMIGDVLFTPSSETPDDIGHSAVVTENLENVVFSYHLVRFRVKRNLLDIDFSGHVFNKSDILNEFSRRATGSTRYTLSLKDFNEITTKLPELNEQKAISSVLTTADKEIELLEKKLEAFKTQKKGLMQVRSEERRVGKEGSSRWSHGGR